MKLDTTKVYYLGDLSGEELKELEKETGNTELLVACKERFVLKYNEDRKKWLLNDVLLMINSLNAKTLFTQPNNERIAQIQLRIQELNNELIELDEEMRTLTYEKEYLRLVCSYCGINPNKEICPHPKKCSEKEKIYTPSK